MSDLANVSGTSCHFLSYNRPLVFLTREIFYIQPGLNNMRVNLTDAMEFLMHRIDFLTGCAFESLLSGNKIASILSFLTRGSSPEIKNV